MPHQPPSGRLELELLGVVEAADRRPEDLEDEIRRRLQEYVLEPDVSVSIESSEQRSVMARVAVAAAGPEAPPGAGRHRDDRLEPIVAARRAPPVLPRAAGTRTERSAEDDERASVDRTLPLDRPAARDFASAKGHVWIVGLARKPGRYPVSVTPTILRAIEVAGLRPGADLGKLEVERHDGQTVFVDLGSIRSGTIPDLRLLPGDNIVIPGVGW